MIKRFILAVAIAVGICLLLSSPVTAQSREEVIKLFKEAEALRENARTNEDLKRAAEKYEHLLKIFERAKFDEGITQVAGTLGTMYADWGMFEKALTYHEESLASSKRIDNPKAELNALHSIAGIHLEQGHPDEARDSFARFLARSREKADQKAEHRALVGLAQVSMGIGHYDEASSYFIKALDILHKHLQQDPVEEANLNLSLGILYKGTGQYSKAKKSYEEARDAYHRLDMGVDEGRALNNLANLYASWGEHEKALKHYEEALKQFKRWHSPREEGRTLVNMGRVFQSLGNSGAALSRFEQGRAIYERLGVETSYANELIAHSYLDLGRFDKASKYVDWVGWKNTARARSYLLKSDYETAEAYYKLLLTLNEKTRNAELLFAGYTGLGMAYEGRSVYPRAEECFRQAVAQSEELRSTLDLLEREKFFEVTSGGFPRTTPYKGLARVLLELERPLEALKSSEHIKARYFAEAMSKRSETTRSDVPADILMKDRRVNEKIAAVKANRQKARDRGDHRIVADWDSQVKQAEQELASHVRDLRERYPLFAASKYPQDMDLSQAALKEHEWVLEYDVADPGLLIYLTKGKKLVKALFKPVTRKDLDALVKRFRDPLRLDIKKLLAFDFSTGKRLSDLLLADIVNDLPEGAPLIVVPDDCLGALPFEALVLTEGGRTARGGKLVETRGVDYFGDRNPISYQQSITALTLARTLGSKLRQGPRTLAMVDPVFSDDDPRLARIKVDERKRLLSLVEKDRLASMAIEKGVVWRRLELTAQLGRSLKKASPASTDLYEGLQAKKSVLFDKDLGPYSSIVFGTHGYYGKELADIREPVLVLTLVDQPKGWDGYLRLSEVMGLKLNSEVAALTACQSGLGQQISGEGTMGMGRAFQYAGAKSVLMSLWNVADKSSVMLAEGFFKHLRQGKSKLEALKLARDEVRKAGYDHPYFWAPFILIGEAD